MKPLPITRNLLEKLYVQDKKSCREVGEIISRSTKSVCRYLQKFGIKARPFSTKGMKVWFGRKHTKETKEKIRQTRIGTKHTKEQIEKIRTWMLKNNPFRGKHHTEESKNKQRKKMAGKKLSLEHRLKVLKSLQFGERYRLKGELHPHWKGGISGVNARIRRSKTYREWREAVFKRDNWTCVFCNQKGSVQADHIAPFELFPELRFSVDNGRTLCIKCHRKTETFGFKSRKTNKVE